MSYHCLHNIVPMIVLGALTACAMVMTVIPNITVFPLDVIFVFCSPLCVVCTELHVVHSFPVLIGMDDFIVLR